MPFDTKELFFKEFMKAILVSIHPPKILPEEKIKKIREIIRKMPPSPVVAQTLQVMGLEKLNQFILDPNVQTVECPGPEKPILITRVGVVQPTNMVLSEKEIERIMKEFSRITRIPLIEGVFKAVIGNLIITAVVSEYVGTRFIIQKRILV